MKKGWMAVYAVSQLATFVLLPLGLILKNQILLYLVSPFALISLIFLVRFLIRSGRKSDPDQRQDDPDRKKDNLD